MARPTSESPAGRVVRTSIALTTATVLAVGLVALVHDRTQPYIEASQRAQQLRQLTAILGGVTFDNDPLTDTVQVHDPELLGTDEAVTAYRVRLGDEPVAVLLETTAPDGYAGAIRLLVAIDAHGRIIGTRVLDHRETPGLGDFIEERRSPWIRGFDGRALGDPPLERWTVRKDGGDFDQYTGATVTPRAVVGAVRNTLRYYQHHRDRLLAPPAPAAP